MPVVAVALALACALLFAGHPAEAVEPIEEAFGLRFGSEYPPSGDPEAFTTLNGARALGLEDTIGSLVPGKEADIVALDLGALEAQPIFHPLSQIVYASSRHQVSDVWVAGRHVLKDRVLLTLDVEALHARAHEWRGRIERWA